MHPYLDEEVQDHIVASVKRALEKQHRRAAAE